MKDTETFYAESRAHWREWLNENQDKVPSIWLIQYRQKSGVPTLTWSEAVDEALCFGWIDSTKRPIDDQKFMQFFTRRKPDSTWSKINKDKVDRLIAEELMMPAGLRTIEIAKENGSWTILDSVEALHIPGDLTAAFIAHPGSEAYFESLSKSIKKQLLYWVISAKREETRSKRILEIVENAAQNKKPKQFG